MIKITVRILFIIVLISFVTTLSFTFFLYLLQLVVLQLLLVFLFYRDDGFITLVDTIFHLDALSFMVHALSILVPQIFFLLRYLNLVAAF